MRRAFLVLTGLVMSCAAPAFGQGVQPSAGVMRAAISPELTAERAAELFADAVLTGCVPAISDGGTFAERMGERASADVDEETRRQSGAGADEAVFDILAGKGVVVAREKPGRCVVSVYGPPAVTTIMNVAQTLAGAPGFQRMAAPAGQGGGVAQNFYRASGGRSVLVQLVGSEPGTPGHRSRFSVITATVFSPAG